LTSSIGWILTVSGLITALGGLVALLNPQFQLRSTYGVENPASIAVFLMRHWGVLILAVGCLIIYGAYDPAIRVPVLIAAIAEKFAIGLLVFFGPVKRGDGRAVMGSVNRDGARADGTASGKSRPLLTVATGSPGEQIPTRSAPTEIVMVGRDERRTAVCGTDSIAGPMFPTEFSQATNLSSSLRLILSPSA
jgi:hypothetical protein